ncbi:hypothetical protein [Longimicrobium sp.]|uniref:hypothetical protein n=1 Tax=Longimicrobium sp. TaxID=2029185 RepID=UPI002C842E7E|nr:hypothetical protein [Longimicrobium sp.]HSU14326.1 hypothetical protein [Longimicrobium sp.]
MARTLILIASLWFIAIGGWLTLPQRPDGCEVCGTPAAGLAIGLATLACGIVSLIVAVRMPPANPGSVLRR